MPGYLYNIRKKSESRFGDDNKHNILISYNYLLYFKFLYKYQKDYKKNLKILFYELKKFYLVLFVFKNLKVKKFISISIKFFRQLLNNYISQDYKIFIKTIISKLKN